MLLFGMVGTAGALDVSETIVYQAAEITDEKLIQERMDKGITDDASIKVQAVVNGDIFIDDVGRKWKLVATDVKYTTQKLKEVVLGEKRQTDFVVNSSVKAIVVPFDSGDNLPINDNDGDKYDVARLDQTSYISFEDGITAQGYTDGTATKFHSTKAKVTRNDTVALVSLQVGQEGFGLSSTTKTGTYTTRQKEDVRNISGPSNGTYYTVSANNTNYWWWVKPGASPSATIIGYANATVTRGTQTYYFGTLITRGPF